MTPTPFPLPTATFLPEMSSISEASSFFQGFNFDTLLALISCITGVVALFIGGAAYSYCKKVKNSFNDKKEFEDQSQDHSQRAAGDIINNNGISDNQLSIFAQSLSSMTNANFSMVLDHAYTRFQEQCDRNLQSIVEETQRVIDENKFQIAGYSKIDWIHVYMESAKNASDEYMQKVWARVLARELAHPDSFSYKTLDVLKNLTEKEFHIFESIAAIQINFAIPRKFFENKGSIDPNYNWMMLQRLKDFGLLNLEHSQSIMFLPSLNEVHYQIGYNLMLTIRNLAKEKKEMALSSYLLTSAAQELLEILTAPSDKNDITFLVNSIKQNSPDPDLVYIVRRITKINSDGSATYGEVVFRA